jgi:hypothetical protein
MNSMGSSYQNPCRRGRSITMDPRYTSSRPWGPLIRCLALALLPATHPEALALSLAPRSAGTPIPNRPGGTLYDIPRSRPYLPIVGPPSLRFQDELPPPDLTTQPPAADPPVLGGLRAELAVANRESVVTAAFADPNEDISIPVLAVPEAEEASRKPQGAGYTPPSNPVSILPDDTRRDVGAGDIIPFFQFPGASGQPGVSIAIPTPVQAPEPVQTRSSATYRQQ